MALNYLTLLKPSVFGHLFKFIDKNTTYKVQQAFDTSRKQEACQRGDKKQHLEEVQQCFVDEVVWECAEFSTHHAEDIDGWTVGSFTGEHQRDMESFKGYIKHLLILTRHYLLKNSDYSFLMQHLIEDNNSLESLQVFVVDELDYSELRNPIQSDLFSQRPSWPMFMAKMKERKHLTATLVVFFKANGIKSLDESCELFAISEADPFCKHLFELRFNDTFPGNSILSIQKPELTDNPSRFFIAKLPVLQHLQINAFSLSGSLLDLLAQRARDRISLPLKQMFIIANLDRERSLFHYKPPKIENRSWVALANACPELQLNLCIILGSCAEDFRNFDNMVIGQRAAMIEAKLNTAVDLPVRNGLGSPEIVMTVRHANDNGNDIGTSRFIDPPSTAKDTLLNLLTRSAPLSCLWLEAITADDFIDIVPECGKFCQTLKRVKVLKLKGTVDDLYFKKLTSSQFSMRTFVKVNPGEIEIF